jgi:drug/metabolite transporter (DMT)-like permease
VLKELCLLLVLAFLWGSSYPLIRVALEAFPPFTLVALRVAGVAVLFGVLLLALRAPLPRGRDAWRSLLAQALLGNAVPWALVAWAQQHVSSGLAGVLNSTSPLFVLLFGLAAGRSEAAPAWKWLGALLGVAGVALALLPQPGGGAPLAQLALLLGSMLYAAAALHGRRLVSLSPLASATGTMLWAAVFLVPLSLATERPWTLEPSARALAALALLTVFSTGCALLLYFRLVRTLGPLGVASQSYLRAGIAALLGVALLSEPLAPQLFFGVAAIAASVVTLNLTSARRTA